MGRSMLFLRKFALFICAMHFFHQAYANDLSKIFVTNDPADLIQGEVGTMGVSNFDPRSTYKIVMHPRLDAESPTGVRIPSDIKSAVDDLLVTLPKEISKSFQFGIEDNQLTEPLVTCTTSEPETDLLIARWMIVYWSLDDAKSPLVQFFQNHVDDSFFSDTIAAEIMDYACRRNAPQ